MQEPASRADDADEAETVELIRSGRLDAAFARVLHAYRRRVWGIAFAVLRDAAAAEDVAQDVFVKLWRHLGRYDGRARLSTWIYAITRNAAVSALRRRPREASLEDPAVAALAEAVEAAAPAPSAEAAHEDAALWRLVAALPQRQRAVVTLYYQEDRSTEEVAAMLGLPVNTVKTHLHRARARLAAALGAREEDAA